MLPEQISSLFLSLLPLTALTAVCWLFRFTAIRWHDDAERSEWVLWQGQRALVRASSVAVAGLLILGITDIGNVFGLLSALQGDFDSSHFVALFAGLTTLFFLLRSYEDPLSVLAFIWLLAGIFLLYFADLSGWLLLGSFFGLVWLLRRYLCIRLVPPPAPASPVSHWIKNYFNRGAAFTPLPVVREVAGKQISISCEAPVFFGFQWIPVEAASGHFLLAGASGSGKTVQLRLFLQSVLPRLGPGSNERALIFDAKREAASVVNGMNLSAPVRILDPYDSRCAVWDLAADFKTPGDALQLAKLLLPEPKADSDPFWLNTSRGLLADIIRGHILAFQQLRIPHWSFADLIRSLESLETIRAALALHPDTADALKNLREEKTLHGVLATIDQVRRTFEVLGALLDRSFATRDRVFSLTEWMEESGVLILAPSASAEEVIAPYNRLIIERVGQLLLDAPEVDQSATTGRSRTWFVLDEFPRLNRMSRIENLMTNARSKGGVFVLGLQEFSDLKEIYGPNYAATIAGACTHRILFQAPSPEHADYCERIIGSEEVIQLARSESVTISPQGRSFTSGFQAAEKSKPLFLKDEFLTLGKPGERTPLFFTPPWLESFRNWPVFRDLYRFWQVSTFSPIRAICSVQGRIYRDELSFTRAIEALSPLKGENFIPRDVADQFLRPFETEQPTLSAPPTPEPVTPAFNVKEALFNLTPTTTNKTKP